MEALPILIFHFSNNVFDLGFFGGLSLLCLFLLGSVSFIELELTTHEMKCHFVIKGYRIECSFKLHKKLNYSISHRINHL